MCYMPKEKQINVRVPDDLARDIEDYAGRHNLSDAEAMRRFSNRGKQAFGYASDGPTTIQQVVQSTFNFGFILGLAFLLLTFIVSLPFLYAASAVFFVVAVVSILVDRAEPWFSERLPRAIEDDEDPDATSAVDG